ncbi:hypothetical protein V1478_005335 [Vespula squamosa]|uniref:Uncharacterized protein n=1 Tax=Vespula squamosa TaxID=30214 RepID=A0ABD2BDV2_VESSQ
MFVLLAFQDMKVFRACDKEYDPNRIHFRLRSLKPRRSASTIKQASRTASISKIGIAKFIVYYAVWRALVSEQYKIMFHQLYISELLVKVWSSIEIDRDRRLPKTPEEC